MFNFDDIISYLKERSRFVDKEGQHTALRASLHLQKYVKGLHGKQLPGYPAKNTNNTPLLDKGKLRDAVFAEHDRFSWRVSTNRQYIANIQEYGRTWKMTEKQRKFLFGYLFKKEKKRFLKSIGKKGNGYIRIPPRPLWRYAADQQEKELSGIFEDWMNVIFN